MQEIDLSHVMNKIYKEYGRWIDCGPGWHQIIFDIDKELSDIDPDYRIFQIKEKFGEIRYYFHSDDKFKYQQMTAIVERYENIAASTCELTGTAGQLMKRNGLYKTLCNKYIADGWSPVIRLDL